MTYHKRNYAVFQKRRVHFLDLTNYESATFMSLSASATSGTIASVRARLVGGGVVEMADKEGEGGVGDANSN